MRSTLLNVSWKDEISGQDRICALTESYSKGSAARSNNTEIVVPTVTLEGQALEELFVITAKSPDM